ncbi:MAG: heme-binding protein [Pseudomonadota bacterium]
MALMKTAFILAGGAAVLTLAGACAWIYASSTVEQPGYDVVEADGAVEIRRYPELVTASVIRSGPRYDAVRAGFRPLAGYIFAKERPGDKIAMTAPVTQRKGEGQDWTVRFIMPSQYSLDDLPAPAGQDVTLATLPATDRVAIRFSGVADDELIAEQEGLLRDWMAGRGIEASGSPIYAYYNDPFTPGFLRRNEVLFDLAEPPGS